MVATPARIGFVTQATRNVTKTNTAVKIKYGNIARDTGKEPVISYFEDLADGDVAADERLALLSPDRRRMQHTIAGVEHRTSFESPNSDGLTARVIDAERNLNYLALVAGIEIIPDQNIIEVASWGGG